MSYTYVDTKQEANDVEKILYDEIGEYLIDYEIYESDGSWAIDCVFSGYFVPEFFWA